MHYQESKVSIKRGLIQFKFEFRHIQTMEFLDAKSNVMLLGNLGVSKTSSPSP